MALRRHGKVKKESGDADKSLSDKFVDTMSMSTDRIESLHEISIFTFC